jgi:predicted lipoprotein with Yx(FWY)xxD motif
MMHGRSVTLFAGVVPLAIAALVLAGCSSNGSGNGSGGATTPSMSGPAGTVDVASTNLGSILVDSQGLTLYLFQKDMGTQSECTGACASAWPPLETSGQPTVGSGASESMVGTTKRSDGGVQVTYNGHPLYLFSGDQQPGDTNGDGVNAFGGSWFALSAAGNQVTASAQGAGAGAGAPGY